MRKWLEILPLFIVRKMLKWNGFILVIQKENSIVIEKIVEFKKK